MENSSNVDKRQIIKYLNRVLEEAIYHGGDGGGAYFSNEDALLESLNVLLKYLKLDEMCEISKNKYGMIQLEEIASKELLSSKIQKEMQKILNNDEEFKDYKLECIMIDKDDIKNSYGILTNYGEIAFIEMNSKEINKIMNAELNLDLGEENIFKSLENKMKIGYMSMGIHYGLWLEVSRYYPDDTKHKNGVQKYLRYCKENNITKENIDKEFSNKSPYESIPDIMKYYKEERKSEKGR